MLLLQSVERQTAPRITGSCYRRVWMCIAGVWDLETTSFEIPWFLGSGRNSDLWKFLLPICVTGVGWTLAYKFPRWYFFASPPCPSWSQLLSKVLTPKNWNVCSEYSLAVLHLFSIDRAALKNVSGMISYRHWEIVKNIAVALVGKYVPRIIHVWYSYLHLLYHKNQPNVGKYTRHGWYGYRHWFWIHRNSRILFAMLP